MKVARVLAGRYELSEPLGRGGMGEVWRAVDRELGRTVAVKMLPPELARASEFHARLRREARSVARLSHPRIATLHDVGEDTGPDGDVTPFLVMEYVEGRTLSDVVADGPLAVDRALALTDEIADALAHSHEHGLVHRDIKPSNVVLTPSGSVKVLDFGIAKAVAEATTRLTATGAMVGTPAYLSPEQIEDRDVDPRSDVYSLGCLAYELLTGRPPFGGDSPFVVMNQHLTRAPEPPSASRPQLPPEIDTLVLTALAKDPRARYGSARELRAAIAAARTAPAPTAHAVPGIPAPPGPGPFLPTAHVPAPRHEPPAAPVAGPAAVFSGTDVADVLLVAGAAGIMFGFLVSPLNGEAGALGYVVSGLVLVAAVVVAWLPRLAVTVAWFPVGELVGSFGPGRYHFFHDYADGHRLLLAAGAILALAFAPALFGRRVGPGPHVAGFWFVTCGALYLAADRTGVPEAMLVGLPGLLLTVVIGVTEAWQRRLRRLTPAA